MNTREIEESFASPPPFADMIRAGFPNVKPGDQIETRKGNMSGMVEKVKDKRGFYSVSKYILTGEKHDI